MARFPLIAPVTAALLAIPVASALHAEEANPNQPPKHIEDYPNLGTGKSREEIRASFDLGPQLERGVPALQMLEQRRRLDKALSAIQNQRPGMVDAYVVTIALDSDPVFAREAREAGRVLSRRYNAAGRTLTLAGPDGVRNDLPYGSIDALLIGLARIAELMDKDEDVLVLYTTSHGLPLGLAYHYGDTGYGVLSPARFQSVLKELGIKRRILLLSACYSGVFVDPLSSEDTAILTASASNRSSFGCEAENDWTFFGDALINNALRSPQSLKEASLQANGMVAQWEASRRLLASLPQTRIGAGVSAWLPTLESRIPQTTTQPVGRPAIGN